jgi:purine-nucleoside/S-methyl-5'-thioadenosine phosphorylase / adenosine deaminase
MTVVEQVLSNPNHPPTAVPAILPLRSELLSQFPEIVHGLTRRVADLDEADGNVSYSAPRNPTAAWLMRQYWAGEIGVDAETLVVPWQVHGRRAIHLASSDAGKGARPGSDLIGKADGLVTSSSGVTLMTTHADCLPIQLYDPVSRTLGAIHAGWRSTVTGIIASTVGMMIRESGATANSIHVFLGPSICRKCYEVGPDVTTAWESYAGDNGTEAVVGAHGRTTFDLPLANSILLQLMGIDPERIEASGICTRCSDGTWFSHRGQGPLTGRFASMIALRSDS